MPEGERGELRGPEGRHAVTVRRTRVGERLQITDGRGGVATAEAVGVGRDRLILRVLERYRVEPARPTVTLAQALVKGERGELAVELATEAGVDAVLPWRALRCVARWEDGQRGAKALARWRSAAAAATKQSRRAWLPPVGAPVDTAALARRCAGLGASGGAALVLHESAVWPLRGALDELGAVAQLLVVVGPEGGVSDDELAELADAGARPVRLGPQVLRASTAAAVALGAIGALTGRWDFERP